MQEIKLKNHTKTQKKPFSYPTYYRTLTRSSNLKTHTNKHVLENIKTHTGEDSFMCHICNRSYCYKRSLYRHLASHTEGPCYSCHFCQGSYRTKHNLEVHIVAHVDETPTSESSETNDDESSSFNRLFESHQCFEPANLSPTNEEPVTSSTEVSYIHTEDESPSPRRNRSFEHNQSFNSRNSVSIEHCMTSSFSVETSTAKSALAEARKSADDVQL